LATAFPYYTDVTPYINNAGTHHSQKIVAAMAEVLVIFGNVEVEFIAVG